MRTNEEITMEEGATQLLATARQLSDGEDRKAALMLLCACVVLAPNKQTFLDTASRMFDAVSDNATARSEE